MSCKKPGIQRLAFFLFRFPDFSGGMLCLFLFELQRAELSQRSPLARGMRFIRHRAVMSHAGRAVFVAGTVHGSAVLAGTRLRVVKI
jgi:hypothetical protein